MLYIFIIKNKNTFTTQIPLLQAHINLKSRSDAADCRFHLIKGQLKLLLQIQHNFTLFNLIRGITLEPTKHYNKLEFNLCIAVKTIVQKFQNIWQRETKLEQRNRKFAII